LNSTAPNLTNFKKIAGESRRRGQTRHLIEQVLDF
jgi:hypothetical protein